MTHHRPARASTMDTKPDLVIDGRLAFSDYGLTVSLALAAERRCWLVQSLWSLLQRFQVESYADFAGPDEDIEVMLTRVEEWHDIWTATTLLERFCWLGDILFESRLPTTFPQSGVSRSRIFASFLERQAAASKMTAMDLCARDAAALLAVASDRSSAILTTSRPKAPPHLCALLERAGLRVKRSESPATDRLVRSTFGHHLPLPLEMALAGGARIALVFISAPRAAAVALEEADFEPDDLTVDPARDPWRDAHAVWTELVP
ncbi:hypothetical protein [uncultured Jannaschia sp.]|uniref:hypothetical protein n=1 Tax=uncultured Jannaschia sp. TaxID=293347 RepID=UPI00261B680A|nr:hypothetical protein [uncultured Jannaschia sp.]